MKAKLVIPRGWFRLPTGGIVRSGDRSFDADNPDNMLWRKCYYPGEAIRDYEFIIRKRPTK